MEQQVFGHHFYVPLIFECNPLVDRGVTVGHIIWLVGIISQCIVHFQNIALFTLPDLVSIVNAIALDI